MANKGCDLATNTQRQFVMAQTNNVPIRKDFRIFPNAPPIDPGNLIFSEIMESFRESSHDEEHEQPTEALEVELDEDDLSELLSELITDLVEINYGKKFICHICALRHLDISAMQFDVMNVGSAKNDGTISLEAIRYASYFIKNCTGECGRHYMWNNSPKPRPKSDGYEEFRLLK